MLASYSGRTFETTRDAGLCFRKHRAAREAVRAAANADTVKAAMQRIIVCPCRSRYALVTTKAESWQQRWLPALAAALGAVAIGAFIVWRARLRR